MSTIHTEPKAVHGNTATGAACFGTLNLEIRTGSTDDRPPAQGRTVLTLPVTVEAAEQVLECPGYGHGV